jgi:hypothetical protein
VQGWESCPAHSGRLEIQVSWLQTIGQLPVLHLQVAYFDMKVQGILVGGDEPGLVVANLSQGNTLRRGLVPSGQRPSCVAHCRMVSQSTGQKQFTEGESWTHASMKSVPSMKDLRRYAQGTPKAAAM